VKNAITNARSVENFVTLTKPVNVDFSRNIRADASFGFPIQKLKSRFSFGANYRHQRNINLLNEEQSTIDQQTAGATIRYNFRYKEILDISLSADKDHQLTDYEFNQADQIFINSTYTAESNLTILKNYQFSTNFEYLEYENRSTKFNQAIPLLNLSVSRFMLKNKSGELKFAVNNLLDKALGINQTASINYLERQTTNSLGRYFMVSFTYALNKQLNPMGMRRGGMMRIMR
jgi:outer membrane receptor for ferrienterochelin and colicin